MIKAIIIDDEARARSVLNKLLDQYCDGIEVIASCSNVPEGVIKINQLNPDVVFLDIEMPDYSGFELLSFFKNIDFEIIFVTAYSDYALRAFEVSAVDYVLKPIQIDKLKDAVKKLKERIDYNSMQDRLDTLKQNIIGDEITRIALPITDGLLFIDTQKIHHIEADGAYSKVYINDKTSKYVSKKIRFFDELLATNQDFYRVHRSHIVNVKHMERYSRAENFIVLVNGTVVPVSRDRKKGFEGNIAGMML